MSARIHVKKEHIQAFCKKWQIVELSLFGSALRKDFGPESDVDLFDLVDMREERKAVFGREVDLVEEGTIRNPFRRHAIMTTREILYAA